MSTAAGWTKSFWYLYGPAHHYFSPQYQLILYNIDEYEYEL